MITIEDFKDILEQHFAYDRGTMRHYEYGSLKLVICPILNTGLSDIFVLINNQEKKWKKEKTIKQALITFKEEKTQYFRVFLLSNLNTEYDVCETDNALPVWIFSKKNHNEKHILQILDATNLWEEPNSI